MQDHSDLELMATYERLGYQLEEVSIARGRVEQELLHRMTDRHATAIPNEQFLCEVTTRNDYDQGRLTPLLEILNSTDLDGAYAPAHEERRMVGARWDVRRVKALARKYGTQVQGIVEDAKVPGAPRLWVTRREQGS